MRLMPLTKRNHLNPCFWTAHWNARYLETAIAGAPLPTARKQVVHILNLPADRVLQNKVENVHFADGLGLVAIPPETLRQRAEEAGWDEERIRQLVESHPDGVTLDYESQWRAQEALPPYQELLRIIANPDRAELSESLAWLACFIAVQFHRVQSVIFSGLAIFDKFGPGKLEFLLMLRQAMTDPEHLNAVAGSLAKQQWTLYESPTDALPLGDNAIMNTGSTLSVALSPRLLLEIDKTRPWTGRINRTRISRRIAAEYRRRCISNATRHIIFSSPTLLQDWRGTYEYRARRALLAQNLSHIQEIQVPGRPPILKTNALDNALSVRDVLRGPPPGASILAVPPRPR